MNKNTKKTLMAFILIILVIGVGYASLRVNITIEGTSTIKNNNFVIKLLNVVEQAGSVTPTKKATIGTDNSSLSFDVTLANPGEYYSFTVDIENSGTINAEIESFEKTELTTEQQQYLTYEVKYQNGTNVNVGDLLLKESTQTLIVLLKYKENPEEYPSTSEQTLTFSFSVNYIETTKTGESIVRTTNNSHAQVLPNILTSSTNLYTSLNPEVGYYNQTEWLDQVSGYEVVSITIPVVPGDKIKSSSFDAANPLQPSSKGIRVTYLNDDTIVKSLAANETYAEYSANGYLTIPEGVNAICIPWWSASEDNWAYIIS